MIFSLQACNVKLFDNHGKNIEYKDGFFTKDAYYNESIDFKFQRPSGFDFLRIGDEGAFENTALKNKYYNVWSFSSSAKTEAYCWSQDGCITIASDKVKKRQKLDDICNDYIEKIKAKCEERKILEIEEISDVLHVQIANNDFVGVRFTEKVNIWGVLEEKMNMILFTTVSDTLFMIEKQYIARSIIESTPDFDEKYFTNIGSDNVEMEKEKYSNYNEKLAGDDLDIELIDKENDKYWEGHSNTECYVNQSFGMSFIPPFDSEIKYVFPEGILKAAYDGYEYNLATKDDTCHIAISSHEEKNGITSRQYLEDISKKPSEGDCEIYLMPSKKQKELSGQLWSYVNLKIKKDDGKYYFSDNYCKRIGDSIIIIKIDWREDKTSVRDILYKGFSPLFDTKLY